MASGTGGAFAADIKPKELAVALEAARAAVLAVHAAVGIGWPVNRQAARTLRAAEALCRTSVAILQCTLPKPVHAPEPSGPGGAASDGRRRRRPRGKRAGRGTRHSGGMEVEEANTQEDDAMQETGLVKSAPVAAACEPGDTAGSGSLLSVAQASDKETGVTDKEQAVQRSVAALIQSRAEDEADESDFSSEDDALAKAVQLKQREMLARRPAVE